MPVDKDTDERARDADPGTAGVDANEASGQIPQGRRRREEVLAQEAGASTGRAPDPVRGVQDTDEKDGG